MRTLAIVIPAHNEAAQLAETVQHARRAPGARIIVVNGLSTDGTRELACRLADQVVEAPRQRSLQLNAGAAVAGAEVLVFLHADTRLPPTAAACIGRALADPRAVGGAFRLRIDSTRPALRLVAWGVQLRTRLLGMPYGDQALFVRREIFDALGGFRPLEIMEDTDFVRRLRKHGRITIVRDFVTTSDRRWAANGIMRTTLVNWAAALLFALGVPATRIRRFYDRLLVTA